MSLLKKNILANLLGKSWTALITIAFIPLYIKFIGIEGYGLVSFYASFQSIFTIVDMGLSSTLNRELAQLSIQEDKSQESRNLVRSLEIIYWIISILISLIMIKLAPFIVEQWIKPEIISTDLVHTSIILMGFSIAFRFPFSLYQGGLLGLQKQVLFNIINSLMESLKVIGVIFILWLISPTIQAFFLWQMLLCFSQTIITRFFLWKSLPKGEHRSHFQLKLISKIWRIAAGFAGFNTLVIILLQMDKVVLSKMLSLEQFGYYSLASTVAFATNVIVNPINTAIFPHFSRLIAQNDQIGLSNSYNNVSQTVSVLTLPLAFVLALFSQEILALWTNNIFLAGQTYLLLSFLSIGSGLNSLVHVPYTLQFAHGKMKLVICANLIGIIVLLPLLIALTKAYGALGASTVWTLLNVGYLFIVTQAIHKKTPFMKRVKWYRDSIIFPVSGIIPTVLTMRLFFPHNSSGIIQFIFLVITLIFTLVAGVISTPFTRKTSFSFLKSIKVGD
jgi:O-antigen/teichoic acid export membrane protein